MWRIAKNPFQIADCSPLNRTKVHVVLLKKKGELAFTLTCLLEGFKGLNTMAWCYFFYKGFGVKSLAKSRLRMVVKGLGLNKGLYKALNC